MAEYIERQAAIKELRETYEYEYPTASGAFDEYATRIVPNVLRNLPPADVRPVVLCKDCRYSRKPDRHSLAEFAACEGVLICFVDHNFVYPSLGNEMFVSRDHFCGCGEVRDG